MSRDRTKQKTSSSNQTRTTVNFDEEEKYFCGSCGGPYVEMTDEVEMWVACDMCDVRYHSKCEDLLIPPSSSELYICKKCVKL